MNEIKIIPIRENPELLDRAADYFSSKWEIGRKVCEESITDSLTTENPTPRWYLMMLGNEIIGSYGLIENDFMVQKDLTPWLCALNHYPLSDCERSVLTWTSIIKYGIM